MSVPTEQKRLKALFIEWLNLDALIPIREAELVAMKEKRQAMQVEILQGMNEINVVLTSRENEVMAGIRAGKSNKEIASDVGIGVRTVKFHVSSILTKAGKASRREL